MKKKITIIGTAFILAACFALPVASFAQDGSLDLTFDTDGMVTTPIGNAIDNGRSIAIQSDGKIVVAGFSSVNGNIDFALARYNTNGSLDLTFDTDGIVTTPIGTSTDYAYSVAIQPDGKIVVTGCSNIGGNNDFALVRYNTNGSLDTTFDTDGKVTTPVGIYSDNALFVAIQSDGKIVVAGFSANASGFTEFALVRYNTNGSLDSTFDTDGKLTTAVGNDDYAYSAAIQSDGKILVAGTSISGTNYDFALVRYNINGSLDNTFDSDGIVITPIGSYYDEARSIAIQSDGKIVLAGIGNNGSDEDFALVRYNTNGSLDNTFDTDGIVITSVGTANDDAYSVAIQSDGKIVVAGTSNFGGNIDFALIRYNTNGSLDNTFDSDGIVTTPVGTNTDEAQALAIQSDGKIVIAGHSSNGGDFEFAVVRYNNTINGINTTANQNTEITIFPNPTSSTLNIQTTEVIEYIHIYNLIGEVVQTETKNTFSVAELPAGVYLIQLQTTNRIGTNRFIKE